MKSGRSDILLHAVLITLVAMTLLPFFLVLNNSLRTNAEMNHAFFGVPATVKQAVAFTWFKISGQSDRIQLRPVAGEDEKETRRTVEIPPRKLAYGQAIKQLWLDATKGYRYAWGVLRAYMLNSFLVCISTMLGVVFIGSVAAYVFARYRFPGHRALFLAILSFMMIPGVLTLVPSFLLIKSLGLINSYWALILPYVAGGQIMAIFLFKGFFDGLPQELFESARLDGAGHIQQYWHIVLPLSKQIIAVVMIINLLGTWNSFLWPYIVNTDSKFYTVAQGLYVMNYNQIASNQSTLFAAYILSSIPLLVLFIYATKPFMTGVTSGAFKA